MPVYALNRSLEFPPPEWAEPEGLLAVGGDLSVRRLLAAYRRGIFPWFSEGEPILWWCPDPRLVLDPGHVKVSDSMRRILRKGAFSLSLDRAFRAVMEQCSSVPRAGQRGTWITSAMREAYCALHEAGHAHSVEAWQNGNLVGGLYGVAIGQAFFGESMFAHVSNASKVALVALDEQLRERGFTLIDCQVHTDHLVRMGAYEIPRVDFLARLAEAVNGRGVPGKWT
jgi:leucyl/phenylalanyl-tRNA--protein transferase